MTRRELRILNSSVAGLFREFRVTSCQVGENGDVFWYFPANIVLRFNGTGFWLSLAERHPEADEDVL